MLVWQPRNPEMKGADLNYLFKWCLKTLHGDMKQTVVLIRLYEVPVFLEARDLQ